MSNGFRQEVFNVVLAQLLRERGAISAPENVLTLQGRRIMPDVLVYFNGLRTAIEGEVDDQPNAEEKAIASALKRVEDGIAHIGVALIYPSMLRSLDFAELKKNISECDLRVAIVTESENTGFVQGNLEYLENALRTSFDQLVHEDVVIQAVRELDSGIEAFAKVIIDKAGVVERISEVLGIQELPEDE